MKKTIISFMTMLFVTTTIFAFDATNFGPIAFNLSIDNGEGAYYGINNLPPLDHNNPDWDYLNNLPGCYFSEEGSDWENWDILPYDLGTISSLKVNGASTVMKDASGEWFESDDAFRFKYRILPADTEIKTKEGDGWSDEITVNGNGSEKIDDFVYCTISSLDIDITNDNTLEQGESYYLDFKCAYVNYWEGGGPGVNYRDGQWQGFDWLRGRFLFTMKDTASDIEEILDDSNDPIVDTQYYTLQGQRTFVLIDNTIYIKKEIRKSGRECTSKFVVK